MSSSLWSFVTEAFQNGSEMFPNAHEHETYEAQKDSYLCWPLLPTPQPPASWGQLRRRHSTHSDRHVRLSCWTATELWSDTASVRDDLDGKLEGRLSSQGQKWLLKSCSRDDYIPLCFTQGLHFCLVEHRRVILGEEIFRWWLSEKRLLQIQDIIHFQYSTVRPICSVASSWRYCTWSSFH